MGPTLKNKLVNTLEDKPGSNLVKKQFMSTLVNNRVKRACEQAAFTGIQQVPRVSHDGTAAAAVGDRYEC